MPQHSNAVSNRPRVLFFVFLLPLLLNTFCFNAVGQPLGHEKEADKPLSKAEITAVSHLKVPSTSALPSASFVSAVAEATELSPTATQTPRFAKGKPLPKIPPSIATPITLAATTVGNRPAAENLEKSPGDLAWPPFDFGSSISAARAASFTVEQTSPAAVTSAASILAVVTDATLAQPTPGGAASTIPAAGGSTSQSEITAEPSVTLPTRLVGATSSSFSAQPGGIGHATPQATPGAKPSTTKARDMYSQGIQAIAAEVFRRAARTGAPEFLPVKIAARLTATSNEGESTLKADKNSPAVNSREHLKRALCRKYYKLVLGVHSSYNIDTLDCEYRPEPGTYIAEQVKEIPVQKDAAQARLDRIEAFKKLQRDAEANPTDRIIVEWDTTCLKHLPTLIQDQVTDETDAEIPVFEAYELHEASDRVILKRGVYLRDRIGAKEKADPEIRQMLKGREYALGVIASTLGLQVSRKDITAGSAAAAAATAAGKPSASVPTAGNDAAGLHCGIDCKRALQGVLLDATVPTIQAAHYSKLGVDVLHIKNLKRKKKEWNITRASEIPALVIRLAQEHSHSASGAASSLVQFPTGSASPASVLGALATTPDSYLRTTSVHTAELVVSCILKISDDQKREVQSFRSPRVTPVEETSPSGDPEQPRQWHLHSFLGNYTLWADRAWPELAGKPGHPVADNMIVAVLDTGCFIHQDFIDGFDIENSRFWVNRGETDCENHIDDDGNGYVDDCFGWDFVGDQAYPFVDDLGHGTSVTSVLGARHGDALGGRGIIATGKIMCLRVGGRDGIWLSDTIPALDYALRMGAKVSNHSYGGKGFDQAEFSAFRRASQADHLAVTAAGNSGCDIDKDESCLFTPGAFDLDGILNVGANDVAGYRTSFSNYGKKGVDVYAPGKSIFVGTNKAPNNLGKTCKHCKTSGSCEKVCLSCKAVGFVAIKDGVLDDITAPLGYEFIDGTSFAAPMVSGIAAALWTHFEITQPVGWVSSTQKKSLRVKEAIMYSVTGSRGVAGAGRVNGVVNFYKALHYYDTIPPTYAPEFPDPPNGYQPQGSSSLKGSTPTILLITLAVSVHILSLL